MNDDAVWEDWNGRMDDLNTRIRAKEHHAHVDYVNRIRSRRTKQYWDVMENTPPHVIQGMAVNHATGLHPSSVRTCPMCLLDLIAEVEH